MAEQATPQPGHETRDANVRIIAWTAVGLVIGAVVVHLSMAGLYQFYEAQHPSPDPPSRIAFDTKMIAPQPQLQTNPQADLAQFEKSANERLHSYGWVDREAGVIHIPIERAMELVAERGLPTRGSSTNNASGKTPEQMQHDKAAATKP